MSPLDSAASTNSAGDSSTPSSSCTRSSASAPTACSVSMSTIGWKCTRTPSWSRAWRSCLLARFAPAVADLGHLGRRTPRCGRRRPAWPGPSPARRRAAASPDSSPAAAPAEAMPTLRLTLDGAAVELDRLGQPARSVGRPADAPRRGRHLEQDHANSSPPRRATEHALARAPLEAAAATVRRRSSPASRPSTVVDGLNWSMSHTRTTTRSGRRSASADGQPIEQAHPVGQPGERVGERLVGQRADRLDPLGDVAGVEHDAADGRVVGEVGDDDLEVAPRPASAAAAAARPATPMPCSSGWASVSRSAGRVVGVDQARAGWRPSSSPSP